MTRYLEQWLIPSCRDTGHLTMVSSISSLAISPRFFCHMFRLFSTSHREWVLFYKTWKQRLWSTKRWTIFYGERPCPCFTICLLLYLWWDFSAHSTRGQEMSSWNSDWVTNDLSDSFCCGQKDRCGDWKLRWEDGGTDSKGRDIRKVEDDRHQCHHQLFLLASCWTQLP